MKTKKTILLLGLFSFLAISSFAATLVSRAESSVLWLKGDSTVHAYTAVSQEAVLKGVFPDVKKSAAELLKKAHKGKLTLSVEVKTLKSKKKKLDKNMYKYLKAKDFPEIVFTLDSYKVAPNPLTPSARFLLLEGVVNVAGVDKAVFITATAEVEGEDLRIVGGVDVQMTDFKIKPPKMMLGIIKCKNDISIGFDFLFGLEKKEEARQANRTSD